MATQCKRFGNILRRAQGGREDMGIQFMRIKGGHHLLNLPPGVQFGILHPSHVGSDVMPPREGGEDPLGRGKYRREAELDLIVIQCGSNREAARVGGDFDDGIRDHLMEGARILQQFIRGFPHGLDHEDLFLVEEVVDPLQMAETILDLQLG